jgi:hypothetical protein
MGLSRRCFHRQEAIGCYKALVTKFTGEEFWVDLAGLTFNSARFDAICRLRLDIVSRGGKMKIFRGDNLVAEKDFKADLWSKIPGVEDA